MKKWKFHAIFGGNMRQYPLVIKLDDGEITHKSSFFCCSENHGTHCDCRGYLLEISDSMPKSIAIDESNKF